MDKLTEPTIGCFLYQLKDHKAVPGEFGTYNAFFDYSVAVRKLGQYEDTGLEPEEVAAVKLALMGKSVAEITEFDGISIDRLKELAEADKEGRVVVLPVKEGDTVYFAQWFGTEPHIVKQVIEPYFYASDARDMESTVAFSLSDFGKTVFHTQEQAEQALEEGADNGA